MSELSRRDFLKVALLGAAVGLASCAPNEVKSLITPQSEPEPETSPTPEPTEAQNITAPESFTSQEAILNQNGYVVARNENGDWAVFYQETGTEVVHAKDEHNLVYSTNLGEEIEVSAEAFVVREVPGVDVKAILTFQNSSGDVDHFFLNHKGIDGKEYRYNVTPIEGQENPEVIANYTRIEPEDVWSGRLLYSELLSMEPFPEGTITPEAGHIYRLDYSPAGTLAQVMVGWLGEDGKTYVHPYDSENDPRRWSRFYMSQTPSGVDTIVATQHELTRDGTLVEPYVFGPEWPWDRDYIDPSTGKKINIIDSLFLAKDISDGDYLKYEIHQAAIFSEALGGDGFADGYFSIVRGANAPAVAGNEFYVLPHNNPLLLVPSLEAIIQENVVKQNTGWIANAGNEVSGIQYMLLLGPAGNLRNDY